MYVVMNPSDVCFEVINAGNAKVVMPQKWIFFSNIIRSDCKNTVFCMLGHQIQNSFDGWKWTELSEVLYEVIAFTDDNVQWHTLQEDYFLFN